MDAEIYSNILQRLSALERRVNTVLRVGKVAAVQASPYRVRLDVGPDDAGDPMLTDPLPVLVPRAGDVRAWSPLTVGERALMLSLGGWDYTAFVLPSLVSVDYHPAPSEDLDDEIIAWRTTDGAGEVARLHVHRGATVADSSIALECGSARLLLAGDGAVTLRRTQFDVVAP